MSGAFDPFAEVRAAANLAGRARELAQSRADFKLVWWAERAYGYLSQAEFERQYAYAKQIVRDNLHDADFMNQLNADLRRMAAAIEADRARSVRIAHEVRAERARKEIENAQAR